MIEIPKEYMGSQEGMEKAYAGYLEQLYATRGDTLNAVLKPEVVACSYEDKSLTMAVAAERWMANPNLSLHGGMTATVADLVMGLVSRYFARGLLTPTVNMNVSYLSSVPLEGRLLCRARCVKAGFSLVYIEAELWAEGQQQLAATATATYYVNQRSGK